MHRRRFLQLGVASSLAISFGPDFWRHALADPAQPGPGPYGPLGAPDDNGLRLPAGFSSRVVGASGQPVGDSGYVWHTDPDGGACFPVNDGGWVYVSNQEERARFNGGGVGALRFGPDGELVDAYRILDGTYTNCAGGPTPWGTWLSCEEYALGRVWECDPLGEREPVVYDGMGRYAHEAVAVDPVHGVIYLTEDEPTGLFYRFRATRYPDLRDGVLEAATVSDEGAVTWTEVPVPAGAPIPTRFQVPGATVFNRAEGAWYDAGWVYFCTTGDNRVWAYDTESDRLEIVYDGRALDDPPLNDVDNITVAPSGDLYVAEDAGALQVVLISPEREVAPFVQFTGTDQVGSEIAGPAFSPDGTRLYVSSQRGGPGTRGTTYEITGPFRLGYLGSVGAAIASAGAAAPAAPAPAGSTGPLPGAGAPEAAAELPATGGDSAGVVAGALAVVAGLAIRFRNRRPSDA